MAKVADVRDGAEVSVETGIGWIAKLEEPRGRNAKVEIRAEHLKDPVSSWVDTTSTALYDTVREAAKAGARVEYRIVVKRKQGQPADVPLADIGTRERIRDLEWLDLAGGIVPSGGDPQNAPTPPTLPSAAPTTPGPAPSDPEPPSGPAQALKCGLCGHDLRGGGPVRTVTGIRQHVECPGTSTDPEPSPVDEPGPLPSDPPRGEPANGAGPRIAEGKPWEFHNSDGSLNPGSYAYGAAEGMVLLASDLLLERARAVDTNGGFKPPTEGQVRSLSRRLLRAADRAQAELRADGHVARMAASHTRCRSAVRVALDVYPVPWGADSDALDRWETAVAEHAGIILRLTVELVEGDGT